MDKSTRRSLAAFMLIIGLTVSALAFSTGQLWDDSGKQDLRVSILEQQVQQLQDEAATVARVRKAVSTSATRPTGRPGWTAVPNPRRGWKAVKPCPRLRPVETPDQVGPIPAT